MSKSDKVFRAVLIWGVIYFTVWVAWGYCLNKYPKFAEAVLGPNIDSMYMTGQ